MHLNCTVHASFVFGSLLQLKATHTEMTRLSQPWHKVVTTLAQGCHNAFLQPCHNLGTTLYFKLSQGCDKVVRTLSQGCDKVVRTLSQGCPNIVTRLPQCNLVTTLAQPCILKLSQGCDKVVARLSQGCPNIVTRLPQCTLSLKLWQL